MSYDPSRAWNRAEAVQRMNNAYDKAMRDISTITDKAGVSLTLKQKSEILESYGIKKVDLGGLDARTLRNTVESNYASIVSGNAKLSQDVGRMNGSKAQKQLFERCARVSHNNDETAMLQRLAQKHNVKLSRAEAQLLLDKNKKLLNKKPEEIIKTVKKAKSKSFRAAKAGKAIGARAVTFSVGLGARVANSVDSENVGIGGQDAAAAGTNTKEALAKLTEKQRIQAQYERQIKREANRAKYQYNHGKARIDQRIERTGQRIRDFGNKEVHFRKNKDSGRMTKGKSNQAKQMAKNAKTRARKAAAERMKAKQHVDYVRKLVAKRKAAAKVATAIKQAIVKIISAIITAITSVVSSTVVFAIALVFILIILIIIIVTVIVSIISALLYSPPMGDWYDPQSIKYVDFVEATQDIQTKYYDDCLMLAYRYGGDPPTPAECAINWGEVYTLWAAIINYRSENDMMSTDFGGEFEGSCAYNSGGMFLVADETDASLFLTDGDGADDYIQDLYLAVYFMYYDLRGMDEAGNPFLTDIYNGDRYVPNYASDGTAGGFDYSSFCEENGYPLRNVRTDEVITGALYLDDNGMWAINTDSYPNLYYSYGASDSTGGMDGGAGYICRGYPVFNTDVNSFSQTFEGTSYNKTVYADVNYYGTSMPNSAYTSFSSTTNRKDGWKITALYDEDGSPVTLGDELDTVTISTGSFATLAGTTSGSYDFSDCVTGAQVLVAAEDQCPGCNPRPGTYPGSHYHSFEGITVGSYNVSYEDTTVSYDYSELTFVHRNALEGLDAMHAAYLACYGDYYAVHSGADGAFDISQAYIISSANRTAVEGANTGHDYDEMLLILNQIFDRNEYYPWSTSSGGRFARQGYMSLPGTIYTYPSGDPRNPAVDPWDCYDWIYASIEYALANKWYPTNYDGVGYTTPGGGSMWLPPSGCGYHDFPLAGEPGYNENAWPIPMISWHSQVDLFFEESGVDIPGVSYDETYYLETDIVASVVHSENCFPFKVRADSEYSDWETGDITYVGGGGKWNHLAYFMYRWLTCEHGLSAQTACGCLAALYHETGFASPTTHCCDSDGDWAVGVLQWNTDVPYRSDESNLYENPVIQWCISQGYNWENAGAQLRYADAWLEETGRAWVFDSLHNIQNGSTLVDLLSAESIYYSDANWTMAAWGCYYWARDVEVCTEGAGGGGESGYGSSPAGNESKSRMRSALTYLWYIEHSDPSYVEVEILSEETSG